MASRGLSATIKAPLAEIEAFAAHHLELGAHRLYLYLDDPDPDTQAALKAHPKIRVTACDATHWAKLTGKRPAKHQVRQTANATHAYGRRAEVDWLIHMDVDEFLWPEAPLPDLLGALPDAALCARVRPIEALAGGGTLFKGFIPNGPAREAIVDRLYPTYGRYLKGGFLSHVAGKLFLRTGLGALTVKIHNVFRGEEMNPGEVELHGVDLCHCHAQSWEEWIAAFRYRHEKGSYRAELGPSRPRARGGVTLHELFAEILAQEGEAGLRAFHEETCADTPRLRAALEAEGLLRVRDLDLAAKRRTHFPQSG